MCVCVCVCVLGEERIRAEGRRKKVGERNTKIQSYSSALLLKMGIRCSNIYL